MKLNVAEILKFPSVYLVLGTILAGVTIYLALHVTPNFDQRTIGITVLYGQDAVARNAIYISAVLSGICLLLALFLKFPSTPSDNTETEARTNHGLLLGIVIASNLLLYFLYANPVFLNTFYILSYVTMLGLFINSREKAGCLRDMRWIIVALTYHTLIVGYCLLRKAPTFDIVFFTVFSLILFVFNLIYESAILRFRDNTSLAATARALWPLMLLPMGIILANEAQYTLDVRHDMRFSGFSIWLIGALFLACWSFGIYRRTRAGAIRYTSSEDAGMLASKLLHERFLPLIIMTTVAFAEYSTSINFFSSRDFFHGGEALVPIQQVMQFGSIPFVDFYPPHGLFDMLPQLFYQILNGTPYPESILWGEGYFLGWLPRMLAALFVYFFLGRYLNYKTTFLVMFALPTYHLIHPYYVLFLLPAIALGSIAKTFQQWLVYWCLAFALVFWRIDFGLAVLAATIFVIAAQFMSERSNSLLTRSIGSFVVVFSIIALAFVLLCLTKQLSPLALAQRLINYSQIQTVTGGLEKIVRQFDLAAAIQYFFFPLIGISYLAYFSALALRGQHLANQHRVLAFLAVSSLVMSIRSLNRHSHFEGVFNPYFFSLLASLLPILLLRYSMTMRIALFLMISLFSYILLPRSTSYFQLAYYEFGIEKEYAAPAASRSPISLSDVSPATNRLVFEPSGAENVVSFLNHFLQGNETFYDFTNSPLLYALAEKRLPSYISETLFHTSETTQYSLIADLEKLYETGDLPLVLFGQNSRLDKIDGVDTAVRSYRVAEFIYKMFVPCLSVDNYDIWMSRKVLQDQNCADYLHHLAQSKDFPASLRGAIRPTKPVKQQFELLKLPYVWANFDESDPIGTASEGHTLRITPIDTLPQQKYQLQVPKSIQSEIGNYIHLRILSAHQGRVELTYAQGNSLAFDVIADPQALDYLIRVSSQYAWHQDAFDNMQLQAAFPFSLSHAAILPGD